MIKRRAIMIAWLASFLLMGCRSDIGRDSDLMRSARQRQGSIRIVALDEKRHTAVIEREIKTGDLLHDGKFLEEFRFTNGSWQCVGSPIH